MAKKYELVGQRFGRLTVIERSGLIYDGNKAWLCKCDCGGSATTSTSKLRKGAKRSCGCLEKENNDSLYKHGLYGTRTYRIWSNMKVRCLNPKGKFWDHYGGRGITVADEWLDFQGFYRDMGDCPDGLTIERINNDLGYMKSNCRWASKREQANNRSSNIIIEYDNTTMTLKQFSQKIGVKYTTTYARYKKGWNIDRLAQGYVPKQTP